MFRSFAPAGTSHLARILLGTSILLALPPHGMTPDAIAGERLFDASPAFDTGRYPEAFYPHACATGDLTGDGIPDLVTSNWWSAHNVGVLPGDGTGGYLAPVIHAIGDASLDVAVADFNGDGLPDIIATNTGANYQGTTVDLLVNLGGGSFAPRRTFNALPGPVSVVAADFTGDGRLDAAVAGYGSSGQGTQVALLRNNGAGGFLPPLLTTVGTGPGDLAAGDLSGDGRPDLVVARAGFRLVVLTATAAGGFAAPVEYITQSAAWAGDFYPNVALGDMDRDGDLDVLCSSTRTQLDADYGAICFFRNLGAGVLGNRSYITLPRYLGGAIDIAVADVTGDAWPDILSAHGGNGGWVVTPAAGGGAFAAGFEYAGGNDPFKIDTADADLDGDLDALVLNVYSLTVGVHLNQGNGAFLEPGGRDLEPLSGDIEAGDIDHDGDLDVVASYAYAGGGGLSVVRNNGDGTFAARQNYVGPRGAMTPRLADLNGDGHIDVVWAFDNTSPPYDFAVRLNGGTGNFGPATSWSVGTCGTGDLITMDVDQDGDLDVLLTDYLGCGGIDSPWVWIRRNNGDATFSAPYRLVYATDPKEMAAADFDRDGRDDLLTLHADGVKLVQGLGAGAFGPPREFAIQDTPVELVAGDLSGDGIPDVATANFRGSWQGTVSIMLGRADLTLGAPVTLTATFSTEVSAIGEMQAADADLDGDLDLLLLSYGAQDLLVLENDGHAGFALQQRYSVGAAPGDFRCRDFDGDDRPDLAVNVGLPPANLSRRLVLVPGIQATQTSVAESPRSDEPTVLRLVVRGPNPFRQECGVDFALPARSVVRAAIYDARGREVRTLLDGEMNGGSHSILWDGRDRSGAPAPAGVYFAGLDTGAARATARLILIR